MKNESETPPRGRPPKSKATKQSESIMVRVTVDEYKKLSMEARKLGLSMSALLIQYWRNKGRA